MSGNALIETGHFAELASAVVQQLPRDIDSTTAQGWIENRTSLQKVLRAALLPNAQSIDPTYPVIVNYNLSLEKMIEAGRYDWKNNDITAKHFSVKGKGIKEITTELVHFDRVMDSSDEVIRELDKRGLCPATLEELLAFGAKYPKLQRQFPIVALGSFWQRLVRRVVPCLDGSGSGRILDFSWFGRRWHDYCRFLAVRK